MSEISTKANVFETGQKDEFEVVYQGNRLIGCSNKSLTEYSVKEGTEVICDRAFMNAKDLKCITLPASIKAIGESAFAGCKSLQDINIPEGVTEIRQSTFRDCKSLSCLELPASCIKIDKWAFSDGLETLVCNAPSMQIDKSAFFGCKTLATVMVPEGSAVSYAQALVECRLTPDIDELPTADSNETSCEYNTINNGNQKEKAMEERKKGKLIIEFNCEDSKFWSVWMDAIDEETYSDLEEIAEEYADAYDTSELYDQFYENDCDPREQEQFNLTIKSSPFQFRLLDEEGNEIEKYQPESIDKMIVPLLSANQMEDEYWDDEDEEMMAEKKLMQSILQTISKNCDKNQVALCETLRQLQEGKVEGWCFLSKVFQNQLQSIASKHGFDAAAGTFAVDWYEDTNICNVRAKYPIEWEGKFDFKKLFLLRSIQDADGIPMAQGLNSIADAESTIILNAICYDNRLFSGICKIMNDEDNGDEYPTFEEISDARTEIFSVVSIEAFEEITNNEDDYEK